MRKSELKKLGLECDTGVLNDGLAGNEMKISIDIYGARLEINASSGDTLLSVLKLTDMLLKDEKSRGKK